MPGIADFGAGEVMTTQEIADHVCVRHDLGLEESAGTVQAKSCRLSCPREWTAPASAKVRNEMCRGNSTIAPRSCVMQDSWGILRDLGSELTRPSEPGGGRVHRTIWTPGRRTGRAAEAIDDAGVVSVDFAAAVLFFAERSEPRPPERPYLTTVALRAVCCVS